jgi:hypothetical protein
MAWEITMGKSNVVIADHDEWSDDGETYSQPEIVYRTASTTDGNWILFNPTAIAGDPQYHGDSFINSTFRLGTLHGSDCLPLAIALSNNDNLSSPPCGGLVGIAPKATGIALDFGDTTLFNIDVDGIKNGIITHPDVFNYSYHWTYGSIYETLINAGSVEVASGGNGRENYPNPGPAFPSAYVYSDPIDTSNGSKDVKIIAVGALEDGPIADCPGLDPDWVDGSGNVVSAGTPGAQHPVRRHPHYTAGYEWFDRDYNYSHGTDKFNNSTTVATRIAAKEDAHIDLVAPGEGVMVLEAGDDKLYNPNVAGTSLSSPEVAGVVGLMMSVQKGLGQTGRNVQKKAYDVLTFTADKVQDIDNITTGLPKPSTFNYTLESNDPLHRSWEQRMGFGKVNAYRAVANSIPCIANYSYSTSTDLTTTFTTGNCQNEDGKYLMHMGAWKDATYHWYDYTQVSGVWMGGGNIIPNQSPAWPHYNQGKTYLSGSTATVLTVGTNDILAIDGLLEGDGAANHKITPTSSGGGKILITGYLQDVEVDATASGPVKIDDLIIYSSGASGYSNVTINSNSSNTSEIYGIVHLQDNGKLNVNGYLTIQPGGEIDMDGNNDFEITSGTVTMKASSTISSSAKQVIVDNGAHLIIDGLLPASIFATLHVKSGGTVEITPGSDLHLDKFLIDQNGTFTCDAGGRLTLNKSLATTTNYCNGKFIFEGTSSSHCMITGGVSTCGSVYQAAEVVVKGLTNSPTDPAKTRCTMDYTDDSDVAIEILSAQKGTTTNEGKLSYDNFSANSSFDRPVRCLLTFENSSLISPNVNASIQLATIDHCNFNDEQQGTVEGQVPTSLLRVQGLNLWVMQSAWVNACNFHVLWVGCRTFECPNVSYTGNYFGTYSDGTAGPLGNAIIDQGSGVLYCGNFIQHCSNGGISMISAAYGTMHDNTFSYDSLWSFAAQEGSICDLRNNSFSSYAFPSAWPPQYCLWSSGVGSMINMRDILTLSGYVEYGKNNLNSGTLGNYAYDLVRGSSSKSTSPKVHGGNIHLNCGYNYFGKHSQYHIVNLDPVPPPYVIDVSHNDWDNAVAPAVRYNPINITPTGGPLNTSSTATANCGMVIVDPPECTQNSEPRQRNEAWLTLPNTSSTLKTAFNKASGMLLSDTNSVDTRRTEAQDEMWAGALVDSASTYLTRTLSDFNTVVHSSTAPDTLKGAIWMLKGYLHEQLGQHDSALTAYTTVLSLYHQFSDSVYAQWGAQRVVIPVDTVTLTSDSLKAVYSTHVQADMIAMMDTVPSLGIPLSIQRAGVTSPLGGSDNSLMEVRVQNNPFNAELTVTVTMMKEALVTMELRDVLGRAIPLENSKYRLLQPGADPESFSTANLPSGTYYLRVSTDGGEVKTLKVVKQ